MIKFGQALEKGPGEYRKSGRIRASTRRILASTEKSDQIWASTRRIRASTIKVIESGQVLEKGLSEYRNSDRIWASTRESGQVSEK